MSDTLRTLLGIHQVAILALVGLAQQDVKAFLTAVLAQEAQVLHREGGNVQGGVGALAPLTQVLLDGVPSAHNIRCEMHFKQSSTALCVLNRVGICFAPLASQRSLCLWCKVFVVRL